MLCYVLFPHVSTFLLLFCAISLSGYSSRLKQVGMIVGVCLGIFLAVIIVAIVFLCRQRSRSEENKLRLTARMSGLEECEVINDL